MTRAVTLLKWLKMLGVGLLAAVALFFGGRFSGVIAGKQSKKDELDAENLRTTQAREAEGRQAVVDGRDSGLSPADRLSRNDGRL